jgi:UDP-N-acetylmuramyl pentapeptide phosphotransferase/UDP-N-acetylglucosamine-1-phosphate transferase
MQRRAAVRLARLLWIAWAVVVWNVVFDHVIVVAGRSYLYTAARITAESSRAGHPVYAKMDDWMRPAVTRAFWTATAAAAAILVTGFAAIRAAARTSHVDALQPTRLTP